MKRYRQFEPVLVSEFKTAEWTHPEHNHNHYEFIFIVRGRGVHVINGHIVPYQSGAIFFIGPEEYHYFEIEQETHFIYLKFTDAYRLGYAADSGVLTRQLEYLVKSRETHQHGFPLLAADLLTVHLLFQVVASLKHDTFANQDLIWYQLLSITTILMRNMPELQVDGSRSRDLQAMFCYIHKNIYTPNLLKSQVMAPHFNISPDYLGTYFKRQVGMTIRAYILGYRNTLIRQRIAAGRMILKEIADEFGLTDVSHLSKILQKDHGA